MLEDANIFRPVKRKHNIIKNGKSKGEKWLEILAHTILILHNIAYNAPEKEEEEKCYWNIFCALAFAHTHEKKEGRIIESMYFLRDVRVRVRVCASRKTLNIQLSEYHCIVV